MVLHTQKKGHGCIAPVVKVGVNHGIFHVYHF